ncbi:MAG: hypothetical protein QOG46_1935 [Pseudonocardiales bacterium]|nr:hypothetical protein [Pseudonocardiales bacterium]
MLTDGRLPSGQATRPHRTSSTVTAGSCGCRYSLLWLLPELNLTNNRDSRSRLLADTNHCAAELASCGIRVANAHPVETEGGVLT